MTASAPDGDLPRIVVIALRCEPLTELNLGLWLEMRHQILLGLTFEPADANTCGRTLVVAADEPGRILQMVIPEPVEDEVIDIAVDLVREP